MQAKPKPVVDFSFAHDASAKKDFTGNNIYVPGGFGSSGNERNLSVNNLENIDDLRGENQSTWDKWGNGAAKFVGKTALRAVGGIATPIVGLGALMSGDLSKFYDNDFTNWLGEKEKQLNEALPNYRTDEEKNNFGASVRGANFWADSLLDGASFALAAYISGSGIARGIGVASKLAAGANAAEVITAAQQAGAEAEAVGTLAKVAKGIKFRSAMQEGIGSLVGAANESALEAKGTYDDVREKLTNQLLAKKQRSGDFTPITEEESTALDNQAAKAGNANFAVNLGLTWGTNALQLGKLFKTYTNEAIDMAKVGGKMGEFAYDATKLTGAAGALGQLSPRLGRIASNRWALLGLDAAGEAGQEIGQTYSNELMATHFASSTGAEERGWLDDMGKALDKTLGKDGAESALLGALIGGITGGATGALSEAKRKNEAGEQAVAFANENSLQNFIKAPQLQSMLRVNQLDKVAEEAKNQGKKFDWLNLQSAKFHELVMGNYKIGKFDDLIDSLETLGTASPEEAKTLYGLETGEDTRAEFAKGLIEKAKATKNNYEKLMGLVGYQIGEGKISEEQVAMASLAGALASDMGERQTKIKDQLKTMGFDLDTSIRDRIDNYRKNPEQKAQLLDQYNVDIKGITSSLKAETSLGDKADVGKINELNKSLAKVSKNKDIATDFFNKQFDNDNYLTEFDSFAKDFLNDLQEKEVRKTEKGDILPTNRKEFNTLYSDYRKLEKTKKGFYDFYNEVITQGNESKRLKQVRELVDSKKKDMWNDRWYGIYKNKKSVDAEGNEVQSERIELQPGLYTWRGSYFDKVKKEKVPSSKQNIVEVLDRRLENGVPQVQVKTNGSEPTWKPVSSYNGIGLDTVSNKLGNYGSADQRDIEGLLNPEMQFYLKNKNRIIEYHQPDLGYFEDGKLKLKGVNDAQGTGRTVRGMLAFNNEGNLILRFLDKNGRQRATISGYAVQNGKLLKNKAGKNIRIPAFAVERLTPGNAGGRATAVPQGYTKIYSEEETAQYLFEQSRTRNIERLNEHIETVKNGKNKDFHTITEIEAKLADTNRNIKKLKQRIDRTTNPTKSLQMKGLLSILDNKSQELTDQLQLKTLLIQRAQEQIKAVEDRPSDYTYDDLQNDLQQLATDNDVTAIYDQEKEQRSQAIQKTKQQKAFAKQLVNDLDAITDAKTKVDWAKQSVQDSIVKWVTDNITGPVAQDIVDTLEQDISGISDRYADKTLSFDDVTAILNAIGNTVATNDQFNITYNETKGDLVNSIQQIADAFEEQAMYDLVQSYVREDNINPLLEAQDELALINQIHDELTKDWSVDNTKPFQYGIDKGIFEAGDSISDDEKSTDTQYNIPSTTHNGGWNPFLKTQTPRDATHNADAFRATHLFNSKSRYEEGKYAYQLHTIDTLRSAGISIDIPSGQDSENAVWLTLVRTSDQKIVMLNANGEERSSGQYPHLSMLPAPNYQYAYTDKQGKSVTKYRFHDITDENVNSPIAQNALSEYKAILEDAKTKLANGEKVLWAINRKSFGSPRYDSNPNPITSVINDSNFLNELYKPAGYTADNKVDYNQTSDYYMYLAPTSNPVTLPGIPNQYPVKSGRLYLVDKKSKRVMPLVNRKLSTEDINQLLLGIVHNNDATNKKENETVQEFRQRFVNTVAKQYINWGNRVSEKKKTNAGYHIDFNDNVMAMGIKFGNYTGATPEGKGIYGIEGKETDVSFEQIKEYLLTGTTSPEVDALLNFLSTKYRHISNFELNNDYKPREGGSQRPYYETKYKLEAGIIKEYNNTYKQGYKSWLIKQNAIQSPLVQYKDTQVQYEGIYYGMRNEAPKVVNPDPKKAAVVVLPAPVDTGTAATAPKVVDRLTQLRDIAKTMSDHSKSELFSMISVLEEAGLTTDQILEKLEKPEAKEIVSKVIDEVDRPKLDAWYIGNVVQVVPQATPVVVNTAPVVQPVVTTTPAPVRESKIPRAVVPSSTEVVSPFKKGKVFVLGGSIKYQIDDIVGNDVSVTEIGRGLKTTLGLEDWAVLGTDVKQRGLNSRLAAGQIRFEADKADFDFMEYDENLLNQITQNNTARLPEIQQYFKERYDIDVSLAEPKQLFGNFAGYVRSARKILLQNETPEGAEYHEEYHVVERMLRPSELQGYYNEYRKVVNNKELTDSQVSEALAEGFRYYVLNQKLNQNLGDKILQFFKKLMDLLQSLVFLNRSPKITKLYKEIYAGNNRFTVKPKRSALKASAYKVATRLAIVDNMWYNMQNVAKDFNLVLPSILRNYEYIGPVGARYNPTKIELDKKIQQRGGLGFLEEVLRRSVEDAPPTMQDDMELNHAELINLFENQLLRKLQKHEIELEEETSNDIKGYIQPANEVDHKSRVPAVIKTILATIPSGKLNNLGMQSASDINTILGKLYTTLAGKQSLDEMTEALTSSKDRQLNEVVAAFHLDKRMAEYITEKNADRALDTLMVQAQFVNHFAKQNVNYYTQLVNKSGTVKIINEQKAAVTRPMIDRWRNAIRKAIQKGTPYNQTDSNKLIDFTKILAAAKENGNAVLANLGIKHTATPDLGSGLYAQLQSLTDVRDIIPTITEKWSRGTDAMLAELAAEGKDITFHLQNADGKTVNSIVEQSALSKLIEEANVNRAIPIKLVSLAGLKTDAGVGNVVNDLGNRDSLLVQLNSVLNGIFPYVFTGSKSMSWGLQGLRRFHEFQDIDDIVAGYKPFLEKEYNNIVQWVRMKRDHEVLPKGYSTGGGELKVFKGILPDNVVDKLEKKAKEDVPFDKAYKSITASIIRKAIESHIVKRRNELLNQLKAEKIVVPTESGFQLFGLESRNKNLNNLVDDIYINSELANIQQWQDFIGDFSYYKDPLKRITAINATKQHAEGTERALANYTAYALHTNSSQYIKNLIGSFEGLDSIGLLRNVTIDDVYTSDKALAKEISDKYGDINVADGQGYGAIEHHRMLGFFEGWWNKDLEDIYQHEVGLEQKIEEGKEITQDDLLTQDQVHQYWKVVKTQYFGPQMMQDYEGIAPNFLKFSVFPLLPSVTHGTKLDSLRRWMNTNAVAITSMDSANKVGRLVNSEGKGASGVDFNMDGAIPFIQNLHWKYYGTQTATSDEPHTKQTEGTQAAKIVLSDILQQPIIQTYTTNKDGSRLPISTDSREWVNLYLRTKSARMEREFKELKHSLGLLERGRNYEFKDKNIIYDKLRDAIKTRSDSTGLLIDLDTITDNGQPLDYLPKSVLDGLIWGLVKRPIKHKRFGDAKVQVSSAGFSKADGTLQQDSELKFYPKNEDSTSYAMQVKLPSWFKGDFTVGDIRKIDARLLEVIGFRIPTQALASIEYIEVVEFLPASSNFIVVPAPITTKAGSDFDVDKMNIYYPNVKYTNGVPAYVEEDEVSDEDKYVNFINNIHKDLFSKTDNTSDYFSTAQLVAEEQEYPSFNEFSTWNDSEKLSIAALDNKLLEWEKATLASKNNRKKLLAPNQDDNIKRIAYWVQLVNRPDLKFNLSVDQFKALNDEEYGKWAKKLKSMRPIDLVNPMFLETSRQSFLAGKEVLGAIAKAVTHHVISQIAGLRLSGTYKREVLDNTGEKVVKQEETYSKPKFTVNDAGNLAKVNNVADNAISDTLSEFVNASVDVEKDDYIKYINLTLDNASVYMYLLREGVRPEEVELFMSQPVITHFTNLLGLYQSESYKLQEGITSNSIARNYAIRDTILQYGRAASRSTDFSQKELEKGISEPYTNKSFQAQIFDEYLKYQGIGGELTNLMGSTDFDTKDTGSSYAENALRVYKYQKLVGSNTLFQTNEYDGINGFMYFNDNGTKKFTPLGVAASITSTASNLFDELSLIERTFNFSSLKAEMIDPILDSPYGTEKVAKAITKIKNGFMTYLLQNTKVDGKLAREKTDLLMGDNSVATTIQQIQAWDKHPLHNNYFISQLETNTTKKDADGVLPLRDVLHEVNMRKVMGDGLKLDQLYEAFLEIEDTDPELAEKLIDYSIVRSGVSPSPLSYHQAIPIKSIAARYGRLDSYVPTEYFKDVFIRNNPNDAVILNAYKWENDNGDLRNEDGTPVTKLGDGMYFNNYMINPEKVAEKQNIPLRQAIVETLGAEPLAYYQRTEGSVEGKFNVKTNEEVSPSKMKEILFEIRKTFCNQ